DHAEGVADGFFLVGHQLEPEALLGAEVGVGLRRVARDAEDLRAQRLELRQQRVEVAALGGAAGRVVLRIEIQHQPLAGVRAQGGGAAIGERQLQACRNPRARVGRIGLAHCAPQNFIGSMMASRLRWSQNSRKSSRSAAMCMRAGTPMVTWAEYMSAPVCIAR